MLRIIQELFRFLSNLFGNPIITVNRTFPVHNNSPEKLNIKTATRDLEPFTRIASDVAANIYVVHGQNHHTMTITAEEHVISKITSNVREGTLYLTTSGSYRSKTKIEVRIDLADLKWLRSRDTGNVDVDGSNEELFELSHEGVGDLQYRGSAHELVVMTSATGNTHISGVSAGKLVVNAQGVGNLRMEGHSSTLNLVSQSTGNVNLQNLSVFRANIQVSGVGNVKLDVTEKLTGRVTGVGNVTVTGRPLVEVKNQGVGSFRVK